MSETWKQWEGQTVDGAFPLLRYLGGSPRSAVFLTERNEGGQAVPAAIKLVPSSAQKAELRLARWRQTATLTHPQIIRLYETGHFELGALPVVYVVMELAEENLGQVLSERALTPDETKAMLESVLDVLRYLHSKGFVQGHIRPSSILATGDQLKMSSDHISRAGEPLENPGVPDEYDPPEYARGIIPVPEKTSTAADVWSLGITVIEALTGKAPAPRVAGKSPIPELPENLPQPFAEIANQCLRPTPQHRWKVVQVADCLAGRTPIRPPAQEVIRTRLQTQAAPEELEPAGARRGYGALGALVVLAIAAVAGWGWMRHQSQAAQISQTAQVAPAQVAEQEAAPANSQSNSQSPATAAPAAAAPQVASPPPAQSVGTARQNAAPSAAPAPDAPIRTGDSKSAAAPSFEPPRPGRPHDLRDAVDSGVSRGDVARQVLPDVSHSALETIQGTVKVKIKVDVDPSGGVSGAEFESQGPSKYFAKAAMQAAQNWKFKPAQTAGRQVPSTWELQFEFKRDGATATPTQTAP